jgi:allantoinase
MADVVVRSERVVLPDGMRPAAIHISGGRILGIGAYLDHPAGVAAIDAGDGVVLPGLVDTHVHINDPGRADWEGFDTATRAAAAGGVTTLVDMPLNSIPSTTTAPALDLKRRAASGRCYVDVGFWGGVVPGNRDDLRPLAAAGVLGFKCFLSPSGVDEFPHVAESDLRGALPVLAALDLPLLAHAELPSLLRDPLAVDGSSGPDPRAYVAWLRSRPPESERGAIELLIALAREFRARVHIVHLATGTALPAVAAARADGVPITIETCPHYLTLAAEDIPDGRPEYKCAPPIRERVEQDRLWAGLARGEVDLIATDHSPAPPALKKLADGDVLNSWGGIASLQISLPAVWTSMAARGIPLERVAEWMSAAPARLAGLGGRKGSIAPGLDADLAILDPDTHFVVDGRALYHRHPVTPYDGARLRGRVKTTFVRGQVVFDADEMRGPPIGRLLRRPETS